MPIYDDCPTEVAALARDVMAEHDRHQPLIDCGLKVGYFFAYPEKDEYGKATGNSITVNGMPALARAKKLNLLDRLKTGHDAEILLDGDHWKDATLEERKAILDHELYHFIPVPGKSDDLRRPVLRIRKHDYQFGWFKAIAESHGISSIEVQQAKTPMDEAGQIFWPELTSVSR